MASTQSLVVTLQFVRGPDSATRAPRLDFTLHSQQPVAFGRDGAADIVLDRDKMTFTSRRHATIEFDAEHDVVVLRDLGSSNGTYVNFVRVERAVLTSGDMVIFGGGRTIPMNVAMTQEQKDNERITVWKITYRASGTQRAPSTPVQVRGASKRKPQQTQHRTLHKKEDSAAAESDGNGDDVPPSQLLRKALNDPTASARKPGGSKKAPSKRSRSQVQEDDEDDGEKAKAGDGEVEEAECSPTPNDPSQPIGDDDREENNPKPAKQRGRKPKAKAKKQKMSPTAKKATAAAVIDDDDDVETQNDGDKQQLAESQTKAKSKSKSKAKPPKQEEEEDGFNDDDIFLPSQMLYASPARAVDDDDAQDDDDAEEEEEPGRTDDDDDKLREDNGAETKIARQGSYGLRLSMPGAARDVGTSIALITSPENAAAGAASGHRPSPAGFVAMNLLSDLNLKLDLGSKSRQRQDQQQEWFVPEDDDGEDFLATNDNENNSNNHIDVGAVSDDIPERDPQFDEVMPRAVMSSRVGSFSTNTVRRLTFDNRSWRWMQESPNPGEAGEFTNLSFALRDVTSVRYHGGPGSYFIAIELHTAMSRVVPLVFCETRRDKLRHSTVVFYFKKKVEVMSLVRELHENYPLTLARRMSPLSAAEASKYVGV
eukprot:PhM_4_TR7753/c0_g1_i1/m.60920